MKLSRPQFDLTWRMLGVGLLAASFAGLLLCLALSKQLAKRVSDEGRSRERAVLFGAIESGPLAIARMQAGAISQQQLDLLMSNPAFAERGIVGVEINGGSNGEFHYAKWAREKSAPDNRCLKSELREYQYPDAINPFQVLILSDSCIVLSEENYIHRTALLMSFLIFLISMSAFLMAGLPLLRSVRIGSSLLTNSAEVGDFSKISFVPIRDLTVKAVMGLRAERQQVLAEMTAQMSHDIRSPLASLNAAVHTTGTLDDQTKLQISTAVSRIRDIANGLLAKNREMLQIRPAHFQAATERSVFFSDEPKRVELVSALVEAAVSEKRLQYQDRAHVEISFQATSDSAVVFSEMQPIELHRAISNLIDNSVEASDGSGRIALTLSLNGRYISLKIQDSGKGIPQELLSKVVERGGTFGKKDGNGLGLSHAKSIVESWGGAFQLMSAVGEGTLIDIALPVHEPPIWFAQAAQIKLNSTVVIADDDPSIHQFWDKRLAEALPDSPRVHVYTTAQLLEWYQRNLHADEAFYLCDYEFAGHKETGLDLIEIMGVGKSAILITSHWDDSSVRARCKKIGLKILPKALIEKMRV